MRSTTAGILSSVALFCTGTWAVFAGDVLLALGLISAPLAAFHPIKWIPMIAVGICCGVWARHYVRYVRRHGYLVCPDCDHALTGLPEKGRCPECGTPYEAAQVIRKQRENIDYPRIERRRGEWCEGHRSAGSGDGVR